MAQQNKKQPKPKTGLARCLELASGHKGLVFLAGFLAALAAICSFVPYLSIYYIIREILFVYPDMSLLNVSAISTWGWLALAGILGNIVFYFFALLCSHVAAFGTLYELKVAFADHIMQIPLGYHLTLGSGKMRKIMDENIESVEKFIAHQLPDFVASLVAPLVLVIILLGIDNRNVFLSPHRDHSRISTPVQALGARRGQGASEAAEKETEKNGGVLWKREA